LLGSRSNAYSIDGLLLKTTTRVYDINLSSYYEASASSDAKQIMLRGFGVSDLQLHP
jgi:hypothetical protein